MTKFRIVVLGSRMFVSFDFLEGSGGVVVCILIILSIFYILFIYKNIEYGFWIFKIELRVKVFNIDILKIGVCDFWLLKKSFFFKLRVLLWFYVIYRLFIYFYMFLWKFYKEVIIKCKNYLIFVNIDLFRIFGIVFFSLVSR